MGLSIIFFGRGEGKDGQRRLKVGKSRADGNGPNDYAFKSRPNGSASFRVTSVCPAFLAPLALCVANTLLDEIFPKLLKQFGLHLDDPATICDKSHP